LPTSPHIESFDAAAPAMADFLTLPARLYAGDSLAPPRDTAGERRLFDHAHAFFRYGEERYFTARRGSHTVARCAAIINRRLCERESDTGLIGFFESENDPEAAAALLAAAAAWLEDRGARRIRAPVDRDTWHRYRALTGGFETEPVTLEPYNPPWHGDLFRRSGFTTELDYVTTETDGVREVAERHAPFVERCLRRGTALRGVQRERFDTELALLHRVSQEIFAENYGYSPITFEEFIELYRPARALLDPDFVVMAFDSEGEPVGYCFAFLDPRSLRSASGPALNIKTLGVVPRRRAHGVGLALVGRVYAAALARGLTRVRHCLMKSDNTSRRYDADLTRVIKRFTLFERCIG